MNRSLFRVAPFIAMSLVISAAACSSGGTPAQRVETAYIPGSSGLTIVTDNGSVAATLGAPVDAVWRLMPVAFDSVGIQLSIIDPRKHVIGNEGFRLRGKLGKERLSTYFECGSTQGGANADSYELHVSVLADLKPLRADSTRTSMTVTVSASAKPLQFGQDFSRCSTKAALERRLVDVVSAALKR